MWIALTMVADVMACSVCSVATEENQTQFLISTIGMSLLPLAAIGGGAAWVWHRANKPPETKEVPT